MYDKLVKATPTSIGSILFCKQRVIGYCKKILKSMEKVEEISGTMARASGVGNLASPLNPVTTSR